MGRKRQAAGQPGRQGQQGQQWRRDELEGWQQQQLHLSAP